MAEKTVRLFLSSKAVVSSKPVNKSSSISSKTVVFSDNLSSIVVVSAIVVSAIAVGCCTVLLSLVPKKLPDSEAVPKTREIETGVYSKKILVE